MENKCFTVFSKHKISLLMLTCLLSMASVSFGISYEGYETLDNLYQTMSEHYKNSIPSESHPETQFDPNYNDDHLSAQFNHINDYTHQVDSEGNIHVLALPLPEPIYLNPADIPFLDYLQQTHINIQRTQDNTLREAWNQLMFRIEWLTEGVNHITLDAVLEEWMGFLEEVLVAQEAALNIYRAQLMILEIQRNLAPVLITIF